MSEYIKEKKKEGIGPLGKGKKNILIINSDMFKEGEFKIIGEPGKPRMAKGGRAGFKAGSKGCKLAMKGRGRAYGKNS